MGAVVLSVLAVSGYRSLREVVVPLGRLTVVTGPNGSGKSALHRALRLLAECGSGGVVASLARERGLQSALWAGPESVRGARRSGSVTGTVRRRPVALLLGVGASSAEATGAARFDDTDLGYLVGLGLPQGTQSAFSRDPQVKRELVFAGSQPRPGAVLVRRDRGLVQTRTEAGWETLDDALAPHRSMLAEHAGSREAPELAQVRRRLRDWRFYDALRADPHAPARTPQVGTRTPVLADDGADLAAALQTILEDGDGEALTDTVADAFEGARVQILDAAGLLETGLRRPGLLRPLHASELSDGTLRYLM